MGKTRTPVYARQHDHGPTLPQLYAVDLLAAGKTDTETADLLGHHRTTVTKRGLYDPEFQAALNRRRAGVWGAVANRLRALDALDALAGALDAPVPATRLESASAILKLAAPSPHDLTPGPSEADEIVRRVVDHRRQLHQAELDNLLDEDDDLPDFDDHVRQVRQELSDRARTAEEPPQITG